MKLEVDFQGKTFQIEIEKIESPSREPVFDVRVEGPTGSKTVPVRILRQDQNHWAIDMAGRIENFLMSVEGNTVTVDWRNRYYHVDIYSPKEGFQRKSTSVEVSGIVKVKAHMPGRVVSVPVQQGDKVETGQGLVVIEAMKMQNELKSPKSGIVVSCNIRSGEKVTLGELLFEIE